MCPNKLMNWIDTNGTANTNDDNNSNYNNNNLNINHPCPLQNGNVCDRNIGNCSKSNKNRLINKRTDIYYWTKLKLTSLLVVEYQLNKSAT